MRSTWQFQASKTNWPVQWCNTKSKYRSAAIDHYKKMHAPNSVLCHICKIPILITSPVNYKRHFQCFHPHIKMPQNHQQIMHQQKLQQMPTVSVNCCKVCGKCFVKKNSLNRHLKKAHETKRIYCPLIECYLTAKGMHRVRKHWNAWINVSWILDTNWFKWCPKCFSWGWKWSNCNGKIISIDYKSKTNEIQFFVNRLVLRVIMSPNRNQMKNRLVMKRNELMILIRKCDCFLNRKRKSKRICHT